MGLIDGLLGGLLGGLGKKIGSWFPAKGERDRAKIRAIKEEMDRIAKQPATHRSRARYAYLADQLRKYEQQSQDREG